MKRGFKIIIPEPCSQRWEDLTPRAGGRFCGSCQRTVIDFTQMTDGELFRYFGNHSRKVCGSFNALQTDRVIMEPKKPSGPFILPRLAASLAGILFSLAGKAQTSDTTKTDPPVQIRPLTPKPVTPMVQSAVTAKEINPAMFSGFSVLQGRAGGVCVSPVVVEEKKSFMNTIFSRVEDFSGIFKKPCITAGLPSHLGY